MKEGEEEKEGEKDPPFANTAKDGAPAIVTPRGKRV
jgi:hypothetical protein